MLLGVTEPEGTDEVPELVLVLSAYVRPLAWFTGRETMLRVFLDFVSEDMSINPPLEARSGWLGCWTGPNENVADD